MRVVASLRRRRRAACCVTILLVAAVSALPAAAHHTESTERVPTATMPGAPVSSQGDWKLIANFGANPGTDLEFFRRGSAIYASSGTLGQGSVGHVGQRIIRLTDEKGNVEPTWVADHGSARCASNFAGTMALQHDVQATPQPEAELLLDATDATQRCHDPDGGGIEIIDITGVGHEGGAPVREIHLTRHDGTSHNVTVDATRPWIAYNSNTDVGRPWIDVLDIRTCLGLAGRSLEAKRDACRPLVYRIPFEPTWTAQVQPDGALANPVGCHDITTKPGRIYCAAIYGTAVFDVTNLTDAAGNVRGTPLPCTVVDGTGTTAKVTDCDLGTKDAEYSDAASDADAYEKLGKPAAEGWSLVAKINHPGTNCCNNQTEVPTDEGVSISHEADPSPDGRYVFVTDERGGGVVPPGASCAPGPGNPIGNGGLHVFDIADPANPRYAQMPDGRKAIFLSNNVLPEPTFCNIHLIEQVPDEKRIFAAWYSQGIKIVDYAIDANGAWTFDEVAWLTLPGAQTWAAEFFKITDNPDGTRTYYVMASDVARGIDVYSLTAKPNFLPRVTAQGGGASSVPQTADVAGSTVNRAPGAPGDLPATGGTVPLTVPLVLLPLALFVRLAARRHRRRNEGSYATTL